MPRRILSNLDVATGVAATEVAPTTERMSIAPPSSSPLSTSQAAAATAAAISSGVTIATNPSTVASIGSSITSTVKPVEHVYNATGYLAEHDELDYSILAAFSDMQTVFLACISTLLPLIVALGFAFGVRHVWRKYRNRYSGRPWYRGVCSRDNTVDSLHHRPHSDSVIIQPATRVLSAQDLVNGIDGPRYICETEVTEEVAMAGSNAEYASPGNHANKNANGNIITLTLKNNHLIVETEERAMSMEDGKSCKYDNSDGCSFVIEVQPGYQSDETDVNKGSVDDVTATVTDQQALVHREEHPEDRPSAFENTKLFGSTNTGLSQSDLSVSSQGSVNPSYRYGNQVEYEAGHFGYPVYGGYETDSSSIRLEGCSKWVEFDKSPDTEKTLLNESKASSIEKDNCSDTLPISEKQDSNSSIDLRQDSTDASVSTDTTVKSNPNLQVSGTTPNKLELMEQKALISGDFAKGCAEANKPVITGALLKDESALQEDTFQEQQRKLGNGTLTPEHQGDGDPESEERRKAKGSAFVPCHKRTGSIPPRLIEGNAEPERKSCELDVYAQIKSGTKSLLPGLSPKFELLRNEVSPIDEKKES